MKLRRSRNDSGVNFEKEPLYFATYEQADLPTAADFLSRKQSAGRQ